MKGRRIILFLAFLVLLYVLLFGGSIVRRKRFGDLYRTGWPVPWRSKRCVLASHCDYGIKCPRRGLAMIHFRQSPS